MFDVVDDNNTPFQGPTSLCSKMKGHESRSNIVVFNSITPQVPGEHVLNHRTDRIIFNARPRGNISSENTWPTISTP